MPKSTLSTWNGPAWAAFPAKISSFLGLFLLFAVQLEAGNPDSLQAVEALRESREYYFQHQYPECIEATRVAHRYYSQQGLYCETLLSAFRIARSYARQNRPDSAEVWYQKVIELDWRDYPPELQVASAFASMGYAQMERGENKEGLNNTSIAIEIAEQIDGVPSLKMQSRFHNYARVGYLGLEEPDKALFHLVEALDLGKKSFGEAHPNLGIFYNNLAYHYLVQEDSERAKEYLLLALDCYKGLKKSNRMGHASALEMMGSISYKLKEYDKAMSYWEATIPILENALPEIHIRKGALYNQFVTLYLSLKRWRESLPYLEKANRIYTKLPESNRYGIHLMHYGIVKWLGEGKEAARDTLEKAKRIIWEIGNVSQKAVYFHTVANCFKKLGKTDSAYSYYQKAMAELFPEADLKGYENPKKFDLKLAYQKILIFFLKGEQLLQLWHKYAEKDYLFSSLETFEAGMSFLDQNTISLASDQNILEFRFYTRNLFRGGIEASLTLFEETGDSTYLHKALQFSEKGRAAVLLRAVQSARVQKFAGVPDSLLTKERKYHYQIAQRKKKINSPAGKKNPSQISQWKGELLQIREQLVSLKKTFQEQYPEYHKLKYQSKFKDWASIKKDLQAQGRPLIEYFDADSLFYMFYLNGDELRALRIPQDSSLASMVRTLRKQHVSQDSLCRVGHALYQQLLYPIFGEASLPERLTIVPDGILNYLPFDLLLTQPCRSGQARDYLIRQCALNYQFSINLALEESKHKTPARQSYLGVAPGFSVSAEYDFLKYSREEVQQAQSLMGGKTLLDSAACKAVFMEQAKDFRVVHISSHAEVIDSLPSLSNLKFAENCSGKEGKRLSLSELYALDLNADLTILSACETGIGEIFGGEGVMSLARGFVYAGSASVVTTLWMVNHKSTFQIISSFIDYLQQGLPKDEALRKAKLDYLDDENNSGADLHPYYWAGIVQIGDQKALQTGGSLWLWWALGALGLVLLTIWAWIQRKSLPNPADARSVDNPF